MVPPNVGIQPNEFVSSLAKQAITDGVALSMGLTYVDAINSLKKKSIELWQKFWDSSSESRGFYLHSVMPRIGCKSWFHDSRLYRRLIVLIIRLRMGHAATPRKLFQFNLKDTPFCDCDGIQMGDVNPIFLGCSKKYWSN